MAGRFISYAGEAAVTALLNWGLNDWQAKQVLQTARTYGLNRIPVNGGYGVLDVRFDGGHFQIGGFSGKAAK